VQLEELGKLKNQATSSGQEPETFRLVAQFLKQLRYRVLDLLQNSHLRKFIQACEMQQNGKTFINKQVNRIKKQLVNQATINQLKK
jgi:Leu/Phe-tRNA-protein transferase